jgi:tRNA threonylcarbamoyladenosine biosynthesis protein TsaE
MLEFIINNVEDTLKLGKQLGTKVNPGDIICINGDLGAGKTHFTKGIAKGLGIEDHITSPTFTIVNEYEGGRLKLYHFDVYRVNDPDEIYAIGFDEYIFAKGVSVIEWSDYISELIPEDFLSVHISKLQEQGENFRKIVLIPHGNRYDYVKEITL